jgi:carbon-monoxide dehydrogenase medium subunit
MKPAPFAYVRPKSWSEALKLIAAGARPGAGTQSLGPLLNLRLAQPETVADLRHLPGYAGVAVEATMVRIGAGTTHAAIEDGAVPGRVGEIMKAVARGIAYRPVRNRGTIGGSLAHADPAADWVAVLPALGATAVALGPGHGVGSGERRIAAAAFVQGTFETALAPDELLRFIEVPVLPAGARWGHWKFCRKVGEFSKATACVLALPAAPARAVLAALDGPPLVIEDASALVRDPAAEATRIVAGVSGLTPWRRALAETALRRAVARMTGRMAA